MRTKVYHIPNFLLPIHQLICMNGKSEYGQVMKTGLDKIKQFKDLEAKEKQKKQ